MTARIQQSTTAFVLEMSTQAPLQGSPYLCQSAAALWCTSFSCRRIPVSGQQIYAANTTVSITSLRTKHDAQFSTKIHVARTHATDMHYYLNKQIVFHQQYPEVAAIYCTSKKFWNTFRSTAGRRERLHACLAVQANDGKSINSGKET